jgi:tripartite-type tricarboxylate transporter receptor subunit TctC
MRALVLALAFAGALISAERAGAQAYPSRPITIVVGYPAGGPTDIITRILAQRMSEPLGQSIIIENVSGANGGIGAGRVARAPPDGYTLSLANWNNAVANGAVYPLKYDLATDFAPVALLTSAPLWIVARPTFPANNLAELVAWLKANPGKASAATVGAGSAAHVSGIYFQDRTATSFQFVPYRGGAPAVQDLVAGQVDLMCAEVSATLPYVRAGKLRAYAVLAKTRWSAAPDIPTAAEAGVTGLTISFWHGLWAPRGTQRGVIARLNGAVIGAFSDPSMRRTLTDLGLDIPAGAELTPEALGQFQKAEIEKWWPIIRAAGIRAE